MSAVTLMVVAVVLYVIARWAHDKPAVTVPAVVGGTFAIVIIAALDHGATAEIARGLAWLFVTVAAYNAIGPIAAAAAGKVTGKPPQAITTGMGGPPSA